jgi:hypothetical protein
MSIQKNRRALDESARPKNGTLIASNNTAIIKQNPDGLQAQNDASRITCSSMRAESLRASFDIDSDRIIVALVTARAFNREGLDDDTDEMLRAIWRLMRVSVTPARQELQRIRGRS